MVIELDGWMMISKLRRHTKAEEGMLLHSCIHQTLCFISPSFLSAMASSVKLNRKIYTDVMKLHGNFQQLRNSRTKVNGLSYNAGIKIEKEKKSEIDRNNQKEML